MADFRKWFYALAVVALLAGLTIPASAQGVITCVNNGSVNAPVRAEGYADLVGDLYLSCQGGTPTAAGQPVAPVNIQVTLNTNITSKLVGTSALGFNEALLIIDDPNTTGVNSNRQILNCGAAGAPDNGVSGPGVCEIISTGNPAQTYDGTPNISNTTECSGTYGCGRPNVFQGRQGTVQVTGSTNANSIYFLGVPLDPPGTGTTRTLRITNIRADAEQFGIVSTFLQASITETITISGNNLLTVATPTLTVGTVQRGLITVGSTSGAFQTRLNFIQCNSENTLLAGGTAFSPGGSVCGGSKGGGCNGFSGSASSSFPGPFAGTPIVRLQEGFASAWKVKNVAAILANGTYGTPVPNDYNYNGGTTYPTADDNQNVPGVNYNTESGFEFAPSPNVTPSPNPPTGFGNGTSVTGSSSPFADANGTGIAAAGVATQGTRLALNFGNIPQGSNIWVPPVIYLYRQNATTVPIPTTYTSGVSTGVAVLTVTDQYGNTAFTPATTTSSLVQVSSTNLAVYEVLFDDPSSLEQVDIPVVVSYVSNLSSNPPNGLPATTGGAATVSAGFAPFYSTAAAKQPSATLPVPRFIPGSAGVNLFQIQKCACNLLFPYVVNVGGYDTGIAIANTTSDPGATYGFDSTGAQQGAVTLFYYGTSSNGTAPPTPQTSSVIPSGQLLTFTLSSGNSAQGITNAAAGFDGYIIAQAQFQYCHGYAFITSMGATATAPATSYLGIVLDNGNLNGWLPRTLQSAENDAH